MEKDFDHNNENCIEWINGQSMVTVTFCERKYINKIYALKNRCPEDINIIENKDGSICATIPKKFIKISPPKQVSDEQRQAASERFKQMRASGKL